MSRATRRRGSRGRREISRSGRRAAAARGEERHPSRGPPVASAPSRLNSPGSIAGVLGERDDYDFITLSPNGRRVAVSVLDTARGTRDIWIYDVTRVGARTRFTFDPANEALSLWSLDGTRIIFTVGPHPTSRSCRRAHQAGPAAKNLLQPAASSPSFRTVGLRMASSSSVRRVRRLTLFRRPGVK